jgi:lipopolysaccharide/colanic/teichoic acid biosynthesis glycosyltransferase
MLVAAIAVKLYDGGPVLYKQKRLTIDGKEFYVYKFRSMIVDAEKNGIPRLASDSDERITPVGSVLRKFRIDEFPQLFNILKGEMSVVGPRPERPELNEMYKQEMPEFEFRLKVKAGLTGYAQVTGVYDTSPYDKLKMDLMYIENYSLRMDLQIILMTLKTMLFPPKNNAVSSGGILDAEQQNKRKEENNQ